MDPDKMRQCMSLGYSAKSKIADTIGQCKFSPFLHPLSLYEHTHMNTFISPLYTHLPLCLHTYLHASLNSRLKGLLNMSYLL